MNNKVKVSRISENIFKVVRSKEECNERESLIIRERLPEFSGNLEYTVEEKNGVLNFLHNGRIVLSELDSEFTQSFSIGENNGIYGLGMHQTKELNHRGEVIRIVQKNDVDIAVPFLTSTGGYAILFDNYSFMSVGVDRACNTDTTDDVVPDTVIENSINVYAQDNDCFVYYVILGDSIDSQIAGYRLLTGRAPLYAKWTYGYFQSREHYQTQEEILGIAKEFRKRHIPIDCIIQDWNYWGDYGWNALKWDHNKYPNPEKMIRQIHDEYGMKFMLSVWPSFGKDTEITKKLETVEGGILAKSDVSKERWGRVYDPLNEEAAELVWNEMKKEMLDIGVDGWWLDSTEPSFEADTSLELLDCSPCKLGENKNYLNTYAYSTSKNIYQKQRECREDKRVYILTRSGFSGQQHYGASSWTGDIVATWEVFKKQIVALLGFSVSGIPYSTTDIGAFFVKDCAEVNFVSDYPEGNLNSEYRELYTRWFWFGAFSPLFRSHGTDTPREMWFFGEEGEEFYDSQMKASLLRYSLMPYIYSEAYRIYQEHATLMRPLAMDFSNDDNVKNIQDSYMFGPALLVSPVTDYAVKEKEVYLPKNHIWYDYFTGKCHKGGKTIMADASIDKMPLFVRGGSILLTCKPAESTALLDESVLNVNIYTGADAKTLYYIDEGDNYSYETGNYVVIPMIWDEKKRILTIQAARGNLSNFDFKREFQIYVNGGLQITMSYYGLEISFTL